MPMGPFRQVIAIHRLLMSFLLPRACGELVRPGYPHGYGCNEIKSVDWMGSACLMIRRSALDKIGLLDEGYFIYGDEADLQYRLKKAGWEIYSCPTLQPSITVGEV